MNPEVMNYMVGSEAAQDVNYTIVEAIARPLMKPQKIEDWRAKAEDEGFDFAERHAGGPGLALAIRRVVDFSQISFDACETGTIATRMKKRTTMAMSLRK